MLTTSKTKYAVLCLIFCVALTTPLRSAPLPVSSTLAEKVPNVAERLQSPDIRERLKVLDELVVPIGGDVAGFTLRYDLPTKDYLPVLDSILGEGLRGLDNETLWMALAKACHIIRTLKLREMAKPITRYLGNSNPGIQFEILETLKVTDATASIPDIVPLLKSPEEWIRRVALDTLVELGAKEAIPYLVPRLQDKDHLKRYYALMDLIKVNGKEAAPSIAKLIEDPHLNNRYWALDALVKLGAREHAADIWKLVGRKESDPTKESDHAEAYAIAALIAFGERRAIPMAVARATARDLTRRSQMLDFLVQVRAKAVGPSLVEVLTKDEVLGGDTGTSSNIRRDIMRCLGRLEALEAIPVLKQYVEKPKNNFLRDEAVSTLGVLRAREAVEDLLTLLDERVSGDVYSSAQAAAALARIGDKTT